MIRHSIFLAAVAIFVLQTGCANYKVVANANRQNLDYLQQLEGRLSVGQENQARYNSLKEKSGPELEKFLKKARDSRAKRFKELYSNDTGIKALALQQAVIEKNESERLYPGMNNQKNPAKKAFFQWRLASIEKDYYQQVDRQKQRANDLVSLYRKLVEAIHVLRQNGKDIQDYLELNRFERLFTDGKGMDPEQLKKIGEDLKSLGKRVGSLPGQ